MLDTLFWMLEQVRTKILEGFIIPELNISYWEFCIYSAIVVVVVTVLINSVQVSSGAAMTERQQRKLNAKNLERERVRNSYDTYKVNRERNEAYDDRYRAEHGQRARKR